MTLNCRIDEHLRGPFWTAMIGLAAVAACGSPQAAEAPRPPPTHSISGGTPYIRSTPEQEFDILKNVVTSSGGIQQSLGPSMTKTTNDLFDQLFRSVLKERAAFKCYKAGCYQETEVPDWATIERLDEAILSPGSRLLGLPGAVHRGAPFKLSNGKLSVLWTYLLNDSDYPLLARALKEQSSRTDKNR
jgi:hypothetical protein